MSFNFFQNSLIGLTDRLSNSRKNCYCAFCKTERKVYKKKRINFFNILGSLLGAVIIMFALFQGFDARMILIFVFLLAISEMFVQLRWRVTIVCRYCGFDPVLYLKNPALAAEKVRQKLAQRKNDPAALLGPALKIPVLKKSKNPKDQSRSKDLSAAKGQRLSRQI